MKRGLEGNLVFDSSVILELLYSTSSGVKLKEALKAEKVEGNISEIAVAEISYVLCRKLGSKLDLELKTCCTSFVC
jgi:predicted nucleic acid-binding protein